MFQTVLSILARVFLSLIFLLSGVNKIFHWQEVEGGFVTTLVDWQTRMGGGEILELAIGFAPLLLILATLLEVLGAFMILFNYRVKLGAFFLILFLVPATLIFHPFWHFEGLNMEMELQMFFKNLAILGGLLFVSLKGT